MRNILLIWKIWTLDTEPDSMDMKTGFVPQPACTMWGAVPVVPDIIFSRLDILPGIIYI